MTAEWRCLCVVLGWCALFPPLAAAQNLATASFRFERTVQPGGKGPNRLLVDVPLLSGAASPALADLRFYDSAGREVAYLLVSPPSPEPRWAYGRILPVVSTKETSGLEVDLGKPVACDRLRLSGLPAPFLKRFRLEGSGDREHWTLLVGEGTLFDLPDEQLRRAETDFPYGAYRYLRVTWDDRKSARVRLPATASVREAGPVPAPTPLRTNLEFQKLASEPGRSRFQIRLPAPRLPLAALELTVAPGHLLREARVLEARLAGGELSPELLGSATLRRAERDGLVAADLRIPIRPPQEREVSLVVDDGNNPPLALTAVVAEFAPLPWIYFESGGGQPLAARFGNLALSAPRYDLEAMREHVARLHPPEARWGERRDLQPRQAVAAASPLPAVGAPINPKEFRYSRKIPGGRDGLISLALDAAVLAHCRPALEDLRIADGENRQVPYLLERRDEPLSLELGPPPPAPAEGKSSAPPRAVRSRYRLALPFAGLPESRLVLRTTARVFERNVAVQITRAPADPRSEPRVEAVAEARWRHTDPETAAPELLLELPRLPSLEATLVVDEGDNAPLPIGAVRLLLPSYRLRFFHPPGAGLTLYYGQPALAAPRYDLALLAPRLVGVSGEEVAPAPEQPAAAGPSPAAAQTRLFWGVLIAAVVILLLLLVRLLRTGETAPT